MRLRYGARLLGQDYGHDGIIKTAVQPDNGAIAIN